MPLIKCHECSGQISDHARTCPKCGAPVIAPGVPKNYPDAKKLVTEDCIKAS